MGELERTLYERQHTALAAAEAQRMQPRQRQEMLLLPAQEPESGDDDAGKE